jgi:DNA-binding SARP family transcriptional activator
MSRLRVHALGGLTVLAGGGRPLPIAGSCRPVLGYLLTHRRRRVPRTELAETLWATRPGQPARRCLSTALWRLNRSTRADVPLLNFDGVDAVSFNASTWVDAAALELRLATLLRLPPQTLTRAQLGHLERGVRLYRGDYLIGMDHEWALIERQRLRSLYCDGLYHLILVYAAAARWSDVLNWGQRLSREEPLREDVHRVLMIAYANGGNRAGALAQYRRCEEALAADLGLAPMAETQELARQIASRSTLHFSAREARPQGFDSVRRRIRRVSRVLAASQRQLDVALDALGGAQPPSPP